MARAIRAASGERIPAASKLEAKASSGDSLELWDPDAQLHVKLTSWIAKAGSPYNYPRGHHFMDEADLDRFIRARLRGQGCEGTRPEQARLEPAEEAPQPALRTRSATHGYRLTRTGTGKHMVGGG